MPMTETARRRAGKRAEEVLSLLERHPFMSPAQMGSALELHPATVRGILAQLKGQVASINPCHPDLKVRSLYYRCRPPGEGDPLSADSITDHAHRQLAAYRQLMAIATVYETRCFLIGLGAEPWDAFGWQRYSMELVGGRQRRVLLHGWGLWGGIPFVVEWDRGELPVAGLVRRAQGLAGWYARPESRLAPTMAPALILVTTRWRRASAFTDAFFRAAEKWGGARPPMYITTRQLGVCQGWHSPSWLNVGPGRSESRLFQGMFPLPFDLQSWAVKEDPPRYRLSPLPTRPEGEGGVRRQVALVLATSPADKLTLKRVATHPFMTPAGLAVATGLKRSVVERRTVSVLERLGLVGRVALDGDNYLPRHCSPTRAGLELLAAMAGVGSRDYLDDRGYSLDPDTREPRLRFLSRSPHHLWAAQGVFMAFAMAAEKGQQAGWDQELRVWDGEVDSRRFFTHWGRRRALFPDGYGQYRAEDSVFHFFVEVELTLTRGRGAIRRKLVAYRDFVASGEVERDFPDQELYLLIVGIRWSQMKRWQETAGEVLGPADGRLGVRFTTVVQLERSGATAPAWQDMRGAWTYPFPGLAEQSSATRRQRYLDLGELRRGSWRSEGSVVRG